MKLLDTSVVVDHLRGYQPATALLEEWVSAEEALAASEGTRFELLAGARPAERDQLKELFSVLGWAPVTEDIARRSGQLAQTYRRSHSESALWTTSSPERRRSSAPTW